MDKTGSEHGQDYTGEELQEEAVEPHVEAEQEVTAIKVCKLDKKDISINSIKKNGRTTMINHKMPNL